MAKRKRNQGGAAASPIPLLKSIKPITFNQAKVYRSYNEGKNLLITGYAGTGKSFIGMFLGMRSVDTEAYKSLTIIRSAVPARAQGFLPGTPEEKAAVFETPYRAICDELFNVRGQYDELKRGRKLDFETTSFLRGVTIRDAVILVDEAQNMTESEVNTVMTRVGEGSRLIVCADYRQDDLKRGEVSGFRMLLDRASRMPSFTEVEMQACDIVRSGFVKEWILAGE
jgi:phosphate starvation-inducible PhoH-like protein